MSRRLPAWWLLVLLPTLATIIRGVALGELHPSQWLAQAAPALALLAAVAALRLRRTARTLELSKELRLLAPGLLMTLGLVTVQHLGLGASEEFLDSQFEPLWVLRGIFTHLGMCLAVVGFFFTASLSLGFEYTAGTTTNWAMQPRTRSAQLGVKLAVLGLVLAVELLQLLAGPFVERSDSVLCALALLALVSGPLGAMVLRSAAGGLVFGAVAAVPIVFAALVNDTAAWVTYGAIVTGCLMATFKVARRIDPTRSMPTIVGGHWLARAFHAVSSPVLRKELMVHRLTYGIALTSLAFWAGWATLAALHVRGVIASGIPEGPLAGLALLGALFCGISTFSEERTLDTALWQEANVPRSRLLRMKLATSFGVVVVTSLVLPALLLTLSPGWEALTPYDPTGEELQFGGVALFGLVTLAAWAVAVLGAVPTNTRTEVAMIRTLGLAVGAIVVTGVAVSIGTAVGFGTADEEVFFASSSSVNRFLMRALTVTPLVLASAGALWAAIATWSRGRFAQRLGVAAAVIAAVLALQGFATTRLLETHPLRVSVEHKGKLAAR